MQRTVKKVSLLEGTIRKIRFNKSRESVLLDFSGKNDMTVEFRNSKVKRADHVRKMNLNVGEHVIVSGSTNNESGCYMYGYDIQRSGHVYSGDYVLIKGTVQDIKEMSASCIAVVSEKNGKNIKIKFSKSVFSGHINIGDTITCLCLKSTNTFCTSQCKNWGIQKCAVCTKKSKIMKYDAVEITECAA